MSLSNLITENINDEYCMIHYADFDIVMRKVVALGNPKELKQWFRTGSS